MNDLKTAMKSADPETVGVLRLLLTAIKNKEIAKRGQTGNEELTDDEVVQALLTEAKKRKDAVELFLKGGRVDLAQKEEKELTILQRYLPRQLTPAEIEQAIEKIISALPAKEFGPAMKEVMKELKGKADAKVVTEILKKKLS